jgi:hypothetical protein
MDDEHGAGADQRQRDQVIAVRPELAARETRQQPGIEPVGGEEDHGLAS